MRRSFGPVAHPIPVLYSPDTRLMGCAHSPNSALLNYCRSIRLFASSTSASSEEGIDHAVRMLVFALSSSEAAVAAEACSALSALMESVPACADLCFTFGVIQPLLALVSDNTSPARAVACQTLASSCDASNARWNQVAVAIHRSRVLPSLIDLIHEGVKSEACVWAITLLHGLAQLNLEMCDSICDANGIAPIVTLVCSGANRCQEIAGSTLTALLESSKSATDKARRTRQFYDCVRALRHQGT